MDLKALEELLDCGRLSFASAERLKQQLAVGAGSEPTGTYPLYAVRRRMH